MSEDYSKRSLASLMGPVVCRTGRYWSQRRGHQLYQARRIEFCLLFCGYFWALCRRLVGLAVLCCGIIDAYESFDVLGFLNPGSCASDFGGASAAVALHPDHAGAYGVRLLLWCLSISLILPRRCLCWRLSSLQTSGLRRLGLLGTHSVCWAGR